MVFFHSSGLKSSCLFAIQQGYVAGNVYKDGILPEEKPVQKIKTQKINVCNGQETDKQYKHSQEAI